MRKGIAAASMLALASALAVTGCATAASNGSGAPAASTQNQKPANSKAGKDDSIKIEQIEWTVEEGIRNGERTPVFYFTNNSDFEIFDMKIEFSQNDEMTEKKRKKVFGELMESEFNQGDDFSEYQLISQQDGLVKKGETSKEDSIALNGTGHTLEDLDEFDCFEPNMMRIGYLGGDGRAYQIYCDLVTGKSKDDSQGGIDVSSWSDSEIAAVAPKIEAPAYFITSDDEDFYSVAVLDKTIEDYEKYVEEVKDAGFDKDATFSDTWCDAKNDDGYDISINFDDAADAIHVSINSYNVVEKPEKAEGSDTSKEVSADFKKTVDGYEKFFDEYVDFMNEYKDGGSPAEMMSEYSDYMTEFAETMQKVSDLEQGDLSEADLAYLLEAQGRIAEKTADLI